MSYPAPLFQSTKSSLEAVNKALEEERARRAGDVTAGKAAAARVFELERQLKTVQAEREWGGGG